MHSNVVGHLGGVKDQKIRTRMVALFAHVDPALGGPISVGVKAPVTPITFPTDEATWDNTTTWVTTSTLEY